MSYKEWSVYSQPRLNWIGEGITLSTGETFYVMPDKMVITHDHLAKCGYVGQDEDGDNEIIPEGQGLPYAWIFRTKDNRLLILDAREVGFFREDEPSQEEIDRWWEKLASWGY